MLVYLEYQRAFLKKNKINDKVTYYYKNQYPCHVNSQISPFIVFLNLSLQTCDLNENGESK